MTDTIAEPEVTAQPATETALAVRRPRDMAASIPAKLEYARALADSGLLPAQFRRQPGNVLYAVEYGEMLGLAPMAAITGIHVIEGKPTASAGLISALVRRAGHKLRIKGDAKSATCQIVRCDDPDYTFEVTWTLRRNNDGNPSAEEAGLLGKDVWKKYPASMLKSRAITQCCRDACEEALFGLHYTPEEMGAVVDEEGNLLIVEAVGDGAVTDREWLSHAFARAHAMTALADLRGLWAESAELVGIGRCTRADAEALQDVLRKRMEEVRADEAHAAAEAQVPAQPPYMEAGQGAPEQTQGPVTAVHEAPAAGAQDGPRCPEARIIGDVVFPCVKTGGHRQDPEDAPHRDEEGREWAAPGDAEYDPEGDFVRKFLELAADADEDRVRSMRRELGKAVAGRVITSAVGNELGSALNERMKELRGAK